MTEALALAAGHLSLYQLTIEPGTAFHRLYETGKLSVPQDDDAAALFEITQELCDAAGLTAYEISNHARPGEESRHNLIYWRYGEYAGVGPGAHGRIVAPGGRLALSAERDPARWAAQVEREGHGLVQRDVLSKRDEAEEMLLMGLRLWEGVSLSDLRQRGGHEIARETVAMLARDGLLRTDAEERIAATPQGRLVLNALIGTLAGSLSPRASVAAE